MLGNTIKTMPTIPQMIITAQSGLFFAKIHIWSAPLPFGGDHSAMIAARVHAACSRATLTSRLYPLVPFGGATGPFWNKFLNRGQYRGVWVLAPFHPHWSLLNFGVVPFGLA